MDHRIGLPSRMAAAVRELDGEFYLRREVGELLDVSPSTLRVWGEQDPRLAPHGYAIIDGRKVYLYTGEDITALRAHQLAKYPIRANGLRTRRRGTPKLWSAAEAKERKARLRRIAYLRGRAALAAGEEHRQLELLAEAEIIVGELAEEHKRRFAERTAPRVHEDWLLETA